MSQHLPDFWGCERVMTSNRRKFGPRMLSRWWGALAAMPTSSVAPPAPEPVRLKWTPELVHSYWDGFSQTRLVELSFSKLAGRSLLVAVDHLLPRTGRVIDFGAGDGHLARLLTERGLQVAAYEPSKGRQENLNARLTGCRGFLGVVGTRSRQRFDVAIMAEVIEHILDEELDKTLRRLVALVKPGGTIVVTTPNNEDLELGMAYCPISNTLFHRWQHMRAFTRDTLCALLNEYGVDEVVTHHTGFDESLFLPWDNIWGASDAAAEPPDYIARLRRNESAQIGNQSNLLFIGRRRP